MESVGLRHLCKIERAACSAAAISPMIQTSRPRGGRPSRPITPGRPIRAGGGAAPFAFVVCSWGIKPPRSTLFRWRHSHSGPLAASYNTQSLTHRACRRLSTPVSVAPGGRGAHVLLAAGLGEPGRHRARLQRGEHRSSGGGLCLVGLPVLLLVLHNELWVRAVQLQGPGEGGAGAVSQASVRREEEQRERKAVLAGSARVRELPPCRAAVTPPSNGRAALGSAHTILSFRLRARHACGWRPPIHMRTRAHMHARSPMPTWLNRLKPKASTHTRGPFISSACSRLASLQGDGGGSEQQAAKKIWKRGREGCRPGRVRARAGEGLVRVCPADARCLCHYGGRFAPLPSSCTPSAKSTRTSVEHLTPQRTKKPLAGRSLRAHRLAQKGPRCCERKQCTMTVSGARGTICCRMKASTSAFSSKLSRGKLMHPAMWPPT